MGNPIEIHDFLKWTPPKLVPIISDGLMYAGSRVILYGRYKSLKSMLATRLAIAVSRGDDWLGFNTTKQSVLYLQCEVNETLLHDRMTTMMLGLNGQHHSNFWLWNENSVKLDSLKGYNYMRKMLEQIEPQVLIIDPLYKVVDLGDTSHIQTFVELVDNLVSEYNLSLLIVHHPRKRDKEDDKRKVWGDADNMLGSSIFLNWADTIIRVDRLSEREIDVNFLAVRNAKRDLPKRSFYMTDKLDFVPFVRKET